MEKLKFAYKMIAPCGINCGICRAHLRPKNSCHGCREAEQNRPETRINCRLRLCDKRRGKYCFACTDFPCERLRHLDKRYRTRYDISEIENLNFIRDNGIRKFVDRESRCSISDEGILCMHDKKYYKIER